ncbi:hypothetical protein AT3G43503 [Arabidopsis thaliana]|uniref:Uncharacterized protein n=2 Tax=Arabidopsis thaliana TaxID=3702 RepID=A0A5S9XJ38_ARATH|nr:uncharacterized protein AT3G43503 [Arabidopsis thaliana]ANM63956.1 hypothetical protein AT3G43503 [Arabidopsis thaliana]CAA0384353.1 unnamed protein product [Arabidopsis thaliana]|eukprot:NP_001326015.1 hypothetical protein AT3G43503 [Arabidopsis thaliana]
MIAIKYNSGSKRVVCLRCGDIGHDMILCKIYNAISVKALAIYDVSNPMIQCHGLYLATNVVN